MLDCMFLIVSCLAQAGEAPPPPPATFEGDYGGKTGESQGIVAIMEMVAADSTQNNKKQCWNVLGGSSNRSLVPGPVGPLGHSGPWGMGRYGPIRPDAGGRLAESVSVRLCS